jgi:hypothetical protein
MSRWLDRSEDVRFQNIDERPMRVACGSVSDIRLRLNTSARHDRSAAVCDRVIRGYTINWWFSHQEMMFTWMQCHRKPIPSLRVTSAMPPTLFSVLSLFWNKLHKDYTRNNRRIVGRVVFCAVRVIKGKAINSTQTFLLICILYYNFLFLVNIMRIVCV